MNMRVCLGLRIVCLAASGSATPFRAAPPAPAELKAIDELQERVQNNTQDLVQSRKAYFEIMQTNLANQVKDCCAWNKFIRGVAFRYST